MDTSQVTPPMDTPRHAAKRLHMKLRSPLLLLIMLLAGAQAANASEGAERVRELLARHAATPGASIEVELPPASMKKLAGCASPSVELAGHNPPRWGSVTVRATCAGDSGRPVFVRARVRAQGNYWVLARDIKAGEALHAGLLRRERGDLSRLPRNAVTDPDTLSGRMATRALRQGTILQSHWMKAPALVTRSQTVTLVAEGQGFQVTREGQALDEGGLGDRVRVRLENREVVTGTVSETGTVRLP